MPASQAEKAERFRALHRRAGVFVMPNPWDAGSARMLAGLGFEALATSSGACAGTLGRRKLAIRMTQEVEDRVVGPDTDDDGDDDDADQRGEQACAQLTKVLNQRHPAVFDGASPPGCP